MFFNHISRSLCTVGLALAAVSAQASDVMPSFANVPTGWTTDRYEPASFSNVGTYQSRDNVLGIGINSTGNLANRPSNQQIPFYNTQGRQHAVTGGSGSTMSADLFINSSWRDGSNNGANDGYVRTDMWGVMSDGTDITDYAIIGFTNFGGVARLRVWDPDGDPQGWEDLTTTIAYDTWTSLSVELADTVLEYYVNGVSVYTDETIGATQFSAVIMQAYNFADPGLGADPLPTSNYVAHWSNVPQSNVPEPGSVALVGLALVGLATLRARKSA